MIDSATTDRNAQFVVTQVRVEAHNVAYSTPENMLLPIGHFLPYKNYKITHSR